MPASPMTILPLTLYRFVTDHTQDFLLKRFAAGIAEIYGYLVGRGADTLPHDERACVIRSLCVIYRFKILTCHITSPLDNTIHSLFCRIDIWDDTEKLYEASAENPGGYGEMSILGKRRATLSNGLDYMNKTQRIAKTACFPSWENPYFPIWEI